MPSKCCYQSYLIIIKKKIQVPYNELDTISVLLTFTQVTKMFNVMPCGYIPHWPKLVQIVLAYTNRQLVLSQAFHNILRALVLKIRFVIDTLG